MKQCVKCQTLTNDTLIGGKCVYCRNKALAFVVRKLHEENEKLRKDLAKARYMTVRACKSETTPKERRAMLSSIADQIDEIIREANQPESSQEDARRLKELLGN